MRKTQILLDMDGVLTDLIGDMIQVLNKACNKSFTIKDYQKFNDYAVNDFYGLSYKDCWKIIEDQPYFWLLMSPIPWYKKLYSKLCSIGEVTILTTPESDPKCAQQKLKWLEGWIPTDGVMIGSRKYLMAGNGILIDDYYGNTTIFREAGGQAILIPSNWNTPNLTFEMVWNTIEKGLLGL